MKTEEMAKPACFHTRLTKCGKLWGVNTWQDKGYKPSVVTGNLARPVHAYSSQHSSV